MKKSRFNEAQIIGVLREQEAGSPTADVCRRHGISELIRSPSLDRRKLEFPGFGHVGGLAAPAGFMSVIGGLLPMAPCGRSSLS